MRYGLRFSPDVQHRVASGAAGGCTDGGVSAVAKRSANPNDARAIAQVRADAWRNRIVDMGHRREHGGARIL